MDLEIQNASLRAHLAHLREKALIVLNEYETFSDCADDCHCCYCQLRHALNVTGGLNK